ncbi:hypothetical protein CAG54_03270 [Vibrio sp. V27_P1S3P104]|uniref:hypothetical protein n=1 Tax=unclassified Vibrio TaxID=2614977 RepID=UPI0013734745|nr:hypothetical protein [Vibrio sp. V28_P6S34P95]NAX05153.1 hypothetical protein [Vibrio sp. V30_P3S12P165]NAX33284.1 hypothetical protein [Vibrio sp. V29_P1S30P107]NAX36541.1 hypothetical protein [Vibrio sp. V27_P1S3P104]NAX41426.1 hypothetical protein [Vibrio sp. V26_P1S5P106]
MKASELKQRLNDIPSDIDPDIVMGESWLPEQLVGTQLDDELLFLQFDNAPQENEGEEEGRGFVEHEIDLIRYQLAQIFRGESGQREKIEALVAMLLAAHELTSAEFIEMISEQL